MNRLSGVFFQVRPGDANSAGLARLWRDGNGSLTDDRGFELTDLVALR